MRRLPTGAATLACVVFLLCGAVTFHRATIGAALRCTRAAATAKSDAKKSTSVAWQEYCQVLLCANEFIYVD